MTEFLFEFANAHPYLSYAFFFTGLMFATLWYIVHTVGKKQQEKGEGESELSVPPSPAEIKKLNEDHDVYLGELELNEAVLHCQEIAEKNEGTLCGKNHAILAIWIGELMDRRASADLQEEMKRTEQAIAENRKALKKADETPRTGEEKRWRQACSAADDEMKRETHG